MLPVFYQTCFQRQLKDTQYLTLQILVFLVQIHKQVSIELLSTLMPYPVLFESRRRCVQRFLMLPILKIELLLCPLIKYILRTSLKKTRVLVLAIDRTQWRDKNIFFVSLIWDKRALPLYWQILTKKGSSNLGEQQTLIRPVLRLLKNYKIILLGDREFGSVKLASWLQQKKVRDKTRKIKASSYRYLSYPINKLMGLELALIFCSSFEVKFALRVKQERYIQQEGELFQRLSSLGLIPGTSFYLAGVQVTKQKGFGKFDIAGYWQRKYRHQSNEGWYLLTNLGSSKAALIAYRKHGGIEAMFKDCKTGGYNLETSHAINQRLMSLILLIAIAYSCTILAGRKIKQIGFQKYIGRLKELGRTTRRHSSFWMGLYGQLWIPGMDFFSTLVTQLMLTRRNKLPYFQRGMRAMSLIHSAF